MPDAPARNSSPSPPPCATAGQPISLQTKAILGMVVLVLGSTGLCGYLVAAFAERAMQQTMRMDAEVLMQTTERVLSNYLARDERAVDAFLDDLLQDQRVGFIVLADAQGETRQRRIADPTAWRTFLVSQPDLVTRRAVGHYVALDDGENSALVRGAPIWASGQTNPQADSSPKPSRQLMGYLWIGFRDRSAAARTDMLWATTLGMICLTSLFSIPMVVVLIRRLTRPLRRVVEAIRRLNRGQQPEPLPIARDDEIGVLFRAFNDLAEDLSRTQRQLERTNLHLEDMVHQRTDELQRINRKLQQEMRDKDEFVRTISHDLNAPVRNIAGLTKMLLVKHESDLNESVVGKLERIAANARIEGELLSDLLEMNRIKSQPGKTQPVDLNELLASIADSLAYDIEAKRIELRIAPRLPVLQADRNRIRQVFQNLIDNAIKYMPADADPRRIEVGQCDEHQQFAFYISDTGRGIDEKDRLRIFQIFQRARYSGHEDTPGRGVGLASVKTIVESYGGQVWVRSKPGQGACFLFTLDPRLYSHCQMTRPACVERA